MEPSLVTNVDVLEELFSSLDVPAEPASKKMLRGGWHPEPRRGDPNGTGQAKWHEPVREQAWELLNHADVNDESS